MITHEAGQPGSWTDTHGWSKFAGATGVELLVGTWAGKAAKAKRLTQAKEAAVRFLGENYRMIVNDANDRILLSEDGLRRLRSDLHRPYPHENPHVHVEECIDGVWRGMRIWPKDVPPR